MEGFGDVNASVRFRPHSISAQPLALAFLAAGDDVGDNVVESTGKLVHPGSNAAGLGGSIWSKPWFASRSPSGGLSYSCRVAERMSKPFCVCATGSVKMLS